MVRKPARAEKAIVVTDQTLLQELRQASGTVEVRDANGDFIGTFAPPSRTLPRGIRSPITDDEIERRRREPDGRPLADIVRDLERRS